MPQDSKIKRANRIGVADRKYKPPKKPNEKAMDWLHQKPYALQYDAKRKQNLINEDM